MEINCNLKKITTTRSKDSSDVLLVTTGSKSVGIDMLAKEMSKICMGVSVTKLLEVEYRFEYAQKVNELECTTVGHELHTVVHCTNSALLGVCCPVESE